MPTPTRLRRAAAAFAAVAALGAVSAGHAGAELLEFDATLSIESVESLFPPAPGFNTGPFQYALSPGHGFAHRTPMGGLDAFTDVTGLTGVVTVGDIGTDVSQDFWQFEVRGLGSPALSGVPLRGPLPLLLGEARHFTTNPTGTETATFLQTRNGTLGPGLGGSITSSSPGVFSFRADFGTWIAGPLTLTGVEAPQGITSPMVTGFDQRTPGGLGTLQVVTAIRHETLGSSPLFPAGSQSGALAVLRLEFVPEPARFVMLTWGALLLFALGRRRARR